MNIFAQNSYLIRGSIKDSLTNEPLSFVLVQILRQSDQTLLQYQTTDEQGNFSFRIPHIEKSQLLIKYLGYKEFNKNLPQKNSVVNVLLVPAPQQLKEVIFHIKETEFRDKNDTVFFNLKKIRDSTEVNLKDLVAKLPGISIDKHNKVHYQGKQIDRILIDGNEFFGSKHEMATENLPANAISEIELLKKYKDIDAINDRFSKGKVVLNIKLSKNYRKHIVGNIEGNYGISNKYMGHANFFKFYEKSNLALVSEINNTGESAITIFDYLEMQGGILSLIDKDSENSEIIINDDEIPAYVLYEDNVKNRDVLFNSLNISNTNQKNNSKFNAYIIFNKTNQFGTRQTNTLFSFPTSEIREQRKNINNNKLLNSFFKWKKRINNNKSLNIQLKINGSLSKDTLLSLNNSIGNYLHQYFDNQEFVIGQSIGYKTNLTKNDYFTTTFSFDNVHKKQNKQYLSNDLLWNIPVSGTNLYNLSLKKESVLTNIRQDNSWSHIINNHSDFSADLSFLYKRNKVSAVAEADDDYNIFIKRNEWSILPSIKYKYRFSYHFVVLAKLFNQISFLKVNDVTNKYFLPNPFINIRYKVSKLKTINLGYKHTENLLSEKYLFNDKYIENQNTILVNDINTYFFIPLKSERISFQYNSSNPYKNRNFSFNLSYNYLFNDVSFNIKGYGKYVEKEIIRKPSKAIESSLYISAPFLKLPIYSSMSVRFSYKKNTDIFQNRNNNRITKILVFNYYHFTKFKKSFFQMKYGIKSQISASTNSFERLNYRTLQFEPFISFNGKVYKNTKWLIHYNYLSTKNKFLQYKTHVLNFSVNYTHKKIEWFLKANNILHINSNKAIIQTINDAYTQSVVYYKLPGYITFGMKYNF